MPNIIVIGASAGGIEVLREIIRPLPRNFPAAIFVAMHLSADSPSLLAQILSRAGSLDAVTPNDGDRIEPSKIHVAPPDHHMLVEPGLIRITHGPRENRHRPAIDPLFRTAARAYGPRVLAIVLSGLMNDGTTGLRIVKYEGGTAIVQDPDDAMFPAMPLSAIKAVDVDYVLPATSIAGKVLDLAREPWTEKQPARAKEIRKDERTGEGEKMGEEQDERVMGTPSAFTCPDCNGTLWELRDGDLLRYRCRIGHAFSEDGLRHARDDSVEGALWSAVRILEESAELERKLSVLAVGRADKISANRFKEVANGREEQAEMIRQMLMAKK